MTHLKHLDLNNVLKKVNDMQWAANADELHFLQEFVQHYSDIIEIWSVCAEDPYMSKRGRAENSMLIGKYSPSLVKATRLIARYSLGARTYALDAY